MAKKDQEEKEKTKIDEIISMYDEQIKMLKIFFSTV